jgi:O-methyltransferase
MKQNAPFLINEKISNYLNENIFKTDVDLENLKLQTDKMPENKMQITKEQGQFLSSFIKMMKIKSVLEIGVYTGTSTLYMAKALPDDGHILAIDKNKEWTKIALKHWDLAKVTHKITLQLGDAGDILKTLEMESFDLIFIDADKKNYPRYVEESLRIIKENGFIIIDNILMNGRVLDESENPIVESLSKLYQQIRDNKNISSTFLPFYDGMLLLQKN